ncbi:NRAMP family divalent metal transporter [Alicyclobacillus tolerans]|uniref:Mn2+/Fe2+ NRAMP family transporter n=2 Tax=Alicyclobacillus tolerans TaxID=90970 RepID=A0ABT9LUY4_9BACL|nr:MULTISPECIES: divalent metal cation transporter [Alicyclobacillus]MDP9728075.1 Mn2+/Fe2+ NRAMP family transporter [Alicyclobacillus tengchongensis]SHJ89974.1 Mn2+ and Fe2+ transporters of the NRAMP family [Alicyclobacillus montanus]
MNARENTSRALDRWKVMDAKTKGKYARLLWLLIGPGVLVMLGENDAPSMLSYSASGSQYGIGVFLPFVVLTFLMAFVVQEITVRLGAVSKAGHAELIYKRFGRFWGNFAMIDLIFTNFLTLITEFVGVVAGASYFHISKFIAIPVAIVIILLAYSFRRYWSWERITMALALFNLVFIPIAVLAHPDWSAVGKSFLTFQPFPAGGLNNNNLVIFLSDIGATITPWMLFFQQGAVTDKGLSKHDIRHGQLDTLLGAILATLAAVACIIATSPLFIHHMNSASFGAAQFAQALQPYIGRTGSTLFALGIMEAGLVAATAISTSSAYAYGEVQRKNHSLNSSFKEAKSFYLTLFAIVMVAGGIVLIPHFPLEWVVLIVNVIAVLTMPPALGFLLLLVNDKEIMGEYRNKAWANTLAISIGVFICIAGILYALTAIFPNFTL